MLFYSIDSEAVFVELFFDLFPSYNSKERIQWGGEHLLIRTLEIGQMDGVIVLYTQDWSQGKKNPSTYPGWRFTARCFEHFEAYMYFSTQQIQSVLIMSLLIGHGVLNSHFHWKGLWESVAISLTWWVLLIEIQSLVSYSGIWGLSISCERANHLIVLDNSSL